MQFCFLKKKNSFTFSAVNVFFAIVALIEFFADISTENAQYSYLCQGSVSAANAPRWPLFLCCHWLIFSEETSANPLCTGVVTPHFTSPLLVRRTLLVELFPAAPTWTERVPQQMLLLTSDNLEDHPSRCGKCHPVRVEPTCWGDRQSPSVHRSTSVPEKMKTRWEQIIIELRQRKGEFALYLANGGLIIFTL